MNSCNFVGKITKEVILRGGEDNPYLFITLAVRRPFGDKTDFIDCLIGKKHAKNVAKFCAKGHSLGVTGRLQIESKNTNGTWSNNSTIIVDDITFVQPKESQEKVVPKQEKTLKSFFNPNQVEEKVELTIHEDIINLAKEVSEPKEEIPNFDFPNQKEIEFNIQEDDPFRLFDKDETDDGFTEEDDLDLGDE